jgi:hypothetical protein
MQKNTFFRHIAAPPWSLVWLVGAVCCTALLLLFVEALLLAGERATVRLPLDSREAALLTAGFHAPEEDARGGYRWTAGESRIVMPHAGQGRLAILALHLGPTFAGHDVRSFGLHLNGQQVAEIALDDRPRQYRIVVPQRRLAAGSLGVGLQSETLAVPPDPRQVGLRIEQATLSVIGGAIGPMAMVAPGYALLQVVILAACAVMLRRLALPLLPTVGCLLLVAALLALVTIGQPLISVAYVTRWAWALLLLALLTLALLPAVERHLAWIAPPPLLRVLWGVTLLACAIRLAGSLHPLFEAFDLGLNVGRFYKTLYGELVVTSRSLEFRNNITVYPPGGYIALLPGALLGIAPPLLIQASLALIDGFGALTTAALARALGASSRTALYSALLYAAIPIHLTALWFGLTAQIIGQALMAPLALALLLALQTDTWRAWLAAGWLLSVALLTHIGVAVVAVAWLGLIWLLLRWPEKLAPPVWWHFTWVSLISGIISVIGIYGAVLLLKIEQMALTVDRIQTSGYVPAYALILRAFQISFHEIGLWLLLPGLLLLWQHRLPRGAVALVGSWLGVVVVFVLIEVLTALQVRYIYFLTPLACLAIALLLDRLARRGRAGAGAAWALVVLLLLQGGAVWYVAAAEDIMPSMIPMLR